MSDERHLHITPTRYQWHKFKDALHFYLMVGLLPVGALITYVNIFIGPAQLTPIPEDYTPKHWEYHRVSAFVLLFMVENIYLIRIFVVFVASDFALVGPICVRIATTRLRENVPFLV